MMLRTCDALVVVVATHRSASSTRTHSAHKRLWPLAAIGLQRNSQETDERHAQRQLWWCWLDLLAGPHHTAPQRTGPDLVGMERNVKHFPLVGPKALKKMFGQLNEKYYI